MKNDVWVVWFDESILVFSTKDIAINYVLEEIARVEAKLIDVVEYDEDSTYVIQFKHEDFDSFVSIFPREIDYIPEEIL